MAGRYSVARSQIDDQAPMHLGDSVCSDQKAIDTLLDCRTERATHVTFAPHVEEHGLKRKRAGRGLRLLPFGGAHRIADILEHP